MNEAVVNVTIGETAALEYAAKLRQRLIEITSYAATCMVENTHEWMIGLAQYLNNACEALGDETRFQFSIPARPGYRGEIRKVVDE